MSDIPRPLSNILLNDRTGIFSEDELKRMTFILVLLENYVHRQQNFLPLLEKMFNENKENNE